VLVVDSSSEEVELMEYREPVPRLNSDIRFLSESVGDGRVERGGEDAASVVPISGDAGDPTDLGAGENSGRGSIELSRAGKKSLAENFSGVASTCGEVSIVGDLE
jgi:hypothetical protein